jgi:hypothetical protein
MITVTTGAGMIIIGLVIAVVSWIWLRWSYRLERGQRIWRAWRTAPGGNLWRNGLVVTERRADRQTGVPSDSLTV